MSAVARRFPWPFGRPAIPEPAAEREEVMVAGQWKLMWWKFRRHKLAMIGLLTIGFLYFIVFFNGFLAPYDPNARSATPFSPPNPIHFFRNGTIDPYVYGLEMKADPKTMTRSYVQDKSVQYDVKLFGRGDEYELLWFIPTNIHLFTVEEGGSLFFFGTDSLGRDLFSRTLTGATISLSIGLVGVALSFFLGALLGGLSGYYGGTFDTVMQRIIEFFISIPTIPLWLGLSAAIPPGWSALKTYFAITLILSLEGWTGMARVVRGKLLQVREEDFVLDAQLAGASTWRIVIVHMLPAFTSYLIVQLTLAIPGMIIGETALSFLGLGLRPPVISWGVLIQEAQNVRSVMLYPWLLFPGLFVVITVLAFNFFGDGLRDAADPYKT